MASPAYLTILDDQGKKINASVAIQGREGTAEVLSFDYFVKIPSDPNTGALTGVRKHGDAVITKIYDSASPILFDACCRGKTLKQLKLCWYQIDKSGKQQIYFTHTLSDAKIVKFRQFMPNVKDSANEHCGHHEAIHVRFRKIEIEHPEGSIKAVDEWNEPR